jgi:hypothetical protein
MGESESYSDIYIYVCVSLCRHTHTHALRCFERKGYAMVVDHDDEKDKHDRHLDMSFGVVVIEFCRD